MALQVIYSGPEHRPLVVPVYDANVPQPVRRVGSAMPEPPYDPSCN
jgi:hypothetical protein